jgi:hypothetical protein
MVVPTSPRTAILFRVYCGLLAISVALSGVLMIRPAATARNAPHELVKRAPHEATAARHADLSGRPMINWGGRRQ